MVAGSKLRQRGLVCEIYFITSIENGFDWKCRVVWKQTASCLSAVLRKPKFFLPLFKFTFFVFLSLFKSLRTTCLAWTIMTFLELLLKTVPQAFVHLCFALFEHAVVTVWRKDCCLCCLQLQCGPCLWFQHRCIVSLNYYSLLSPDSEAEGKSNQAWLKISEQPVLVLEPARFQINCGCSCKLQEQTWCFSNLRLPYTA